ncbi:MAG: hypothetical protein ACJ70S_06160, partial [Nitrososphaera sp.]
LHIFKITVAFALPKNGVYTQHVDICAFSMHLNLVVLQVYTIPQTEKEFIIKTMKLLLGLSKVVGN